MVLSASRKALVDEVEFLVEDHNRQCIIKQTTKNKEKLNLTENYFLLFSFHLTYFPWQSKLMSLVELAWL